MFQESYNDLVKKERIQEAGFDLTLPVDQIDATVKRQNTPLSDKGKNEPTEQDLCQTVVLLKKIMPHRSLERAITMLYQTLITKLPTEQIFPEEQQQPPALNSQQQIQAQSEIKQFYSKADLQKTEFPSQYEQQKYKQRRLIAKAFVAKGYGHQHAIQQFKKAKLVYIDYNKFTKEAYKLAMSSIAIQAFRRLELFLKEKCHKKFNFASRDQMKKIMNPLLSPSHFGDSIPVFKKYFRLLYGLSNVTLCEHQSVKFYELAMRQIYGPSYSLDNASSQPVSHTPKQNELQQQQESKSSFETKAQGPLDVWSEQQDIELINTYMQCQSMMKTVDILRMKDFPHGGLQKINLRIIKLTQQAIKKIQRQAQRQNLETPVLSTNDMNSICRSQGNFNLRIEILKILLSERVEKDQLVTALGLLQRLVEGGEQTSRKGGNIDKILQRPKNEDLAIYEQSGQDIIKHQQIIMRDQRQTENINK